MSVYLRKIDIYVLRIVYGNDSYDIRPLLLDPLFDIPARPVFWWNGNQFFLNFWFILNFDFYVECFGSVIQIFLGTTLNVVSHWPCLVLRTALVWRDSFWKRRKNKIKFSEQFWRITSKFWLFFVDFHLQFSHNYMWISHKNMLILLWFLFNSFNFVNISFWQLYTRKPRSLFVQLNNSFYMIPPLTQINTPWSLLNMYTVR